MTTISSNVSASSSITIFSVVPEPTFVSKVLNPTYEKTKIARAGSLKLRTNSPFTSVIPPVVAPLTDTLTPGRGSPDLSLTTPFIVFICCVAEWEDT